MFKINLLRAISALAVAGFAMSSNVAHADTSPTICDGGVSFVDFDNWNGGARLTVGCYSAGTENLFYGYVSANGGTQCSNNVPLDIIKVWKATADEALLAGKQLHIYWAACTDGRKQIVSVSFRR